MLEKNYTLVGYRLLEFEDKKTKNVIAGTQVAVVDSEQNENAVAYPTKIWFADTSLFKTLKDSHYDFGQEVTVSYDVGSNLKLIAKDIK